MNLINTDILPDPYDPQTGDVYEFGDPFVQRLVVEDAPTREDPRVRYRVDGGVDSNLTTVAAFHRHLAGLTRLRGLGRVRVVEAAEASSLMVTRDALWSTLGAVSLGSLRVPTAATHLLDSLGSVYGDRTAIPLAELIDAAFAFGICASRHPELHEIKCPAGHAVGETEGLDCADTPLDSSNILCSCPACGAKLVSKLACETKGTLVCASHHRCGATQPPGLGHLDSAYNKVAMINSLCPPGWRVGMEGPWVAVFQPGETVPMTIMGDSEARVVAEIWRWHMQPVERRLAEFQNGLADILGWPVPQLHDPSGASDIMVAVQAMFGTKTPWRHDHFKAIADDLRLAASLEDSGSCNNVRSAEAMRTAAATIMELAAMMRSIDETLRSNLPDEEEVSTLELLVGLIGKSQVAGLAANERDELYSRRDSDAAEKLRAVERDAAFHEALANAVGKGVIEAQRLGDIIEHLWVAIEGMTGRVGLERDLINAATMKVELEQCFAAAGRAGRAAGDAAASGDRSDLNAIRSAYLDVNGTTGTIGEIVGSIRGSCEMQARVLNLKALVAEREGDIEKLADMLKDVLGRIGTEDAK